MLEHGQCGSVVVSGCEDIQSPFMTNYDLVPGQLCADRPLYQSPFNNFYLFWSALSSVWKIGTGCGSEVVRAAGGSGLEPFVASEGDSHQCFTYSGGGQMLDRNLTMFCVLASCPEREVLM
ncbi:hypothetical protein TeGR_g1443, partial [Tetraparma gracilis]